MMSVSQKRELFEGVYLPLQAAKLKAIRYFLLLFILCFAVCAFGFVYFVQLRWFKIKLRFRLGKLLNCRTIKKNVLTEGKGESTRLNRQSLCHLTEISRVERKCFSQWKRHYIY